MISSWLIKRKLKKQMKGCNYEVAKAMLIKQFSNSVIPKDLAYLFDEFIENPCFDKAFNLIRYDSDFMALFELASKEYIYPFISESHNTKKNK